MSVKTGGSTIRGQPWRFPVDMPLDEIIPKLNAAERRFFATLQSELEKIESFFGAREHGA